MKKNYKRRYKKRNTKMTKQVKSIVKRELDKNVEDKYGHEYTLKGEGTYDFGSATGGLGLLINGLFKGTNRNQRVGNAVKNKHMSAIITCKSVGTVPCNFRVMLIRINEPKGTVFTNSLLFQDNNNGRLTISPYNLNYTSRSKDSYITVLKDRTFALHSYPVYTGVSTTGLAQQKVFRISMKLNSKTIYNDDNNGIITDIVKNAYYLLFYSDQSNASANPELQVCWQYIFEDA